MKKLVIAEKPSVGRDIARVLGCKQQGKKYIEGNEYIVTWGLGHLVTLADPEGYDKKLKTWRMDRFIGWLQGNTETKKPLSCDNSLSCSYL